MSNIILIGFMGSGKTTIGRRLSYRLKQTMTDTDKLIEKQQNLSIPELFERYGESRFRELETESIEYLLRTARNEVVSTGGGMPIRPENRTLLRELGCVIFLRVRAETIIERLKNDTTRPLLRGDNPALKITSMLEERNPAYLETADIVIDVDDKTFDMILTEIEEALEKYEATRN